MILQMLAHLCAWIEYSRAEGAQPRFDRSPNSSVNQFRGAGLEFVGGVLSLEVIYIVALRFKLATMLMTVPYLGVLILMIDPLLLESIETVGVRAVLVGAVIRLEIVDEVRSDAR